MAKSTRHSVPTPLDAEFQKSKKQEASTQAPMPAAEPMLSEELVSNEKSSFQKAKTRQGVASKAEPSSLYLQLHIDNLAKYLSCGLIYPVSWEPEPIYKDNREARVDVLTSFPHHLLLSPGLIGAFKERDILLEIVLSIEEQDNLQPLDAVFLYNDALPISRIKQIFFPSNHAQKEYLASREIFEDFFFPETLATTKFSDLAKIKLPTNSSKVTINNNQFSDKAAYFDRVLGMFGFLKNIPLLRANYTSEVVDFDTNFISALSIINAVVTSNRHSASSPFKLLLNIENSISSGLVSISERQQLLAAIIKKIYSGDSFNYEWAITTLAEYPELNRFSRLFSDLAQEGRTNFRAVLQVLRASALRPDYNLPFILLVLLCKFNNKSRSHTDKQSVRIYFHQEEGASDYEIALCAAALGLYYGYQNMIRDDKNFSLSDKVFNNIATSINRVKFRIDQFLDRFIIESVFQFTYNGKRDLNNGFNYLQYPQERTAFSPTLPLGYTSTPLVLLGKSIANASAPIWNDYVRALPQSISVAHPIFRILSAFDISIPKDTIAKMLNDLPIELQTKVVSLLNTLKK